MTYYTPTEVAARTLARASAINANLSAIEAAFATLPDATVLKQGRQTYVVGGGAADAYTATLTGATYTTGLLLFVKIPATNTGACTLNVNDLGTRAIKRAAGTDPAAGEIAAGGVYGFLYESSANAFIVLGHVAGLTATVQSSATDTTSGRALLVGAFGLGATAPLVGNCAVTDSSIAPGIYRYDTTAGSPSSGGPSGVTRGALYHARLVTGRETQMLVCNAHSTSALAGAVFERTLAGGAWTTWRSGSVVDSGTSSGWDYVKYADGRAECWTQEDQTSVNWISAIGGLYGRSSPLTFTFPFEFAAAPQVFPSAGRTGSNQGAWAGVFADPTTTGVDVQAVTTNTIASGQGKWIACYAKGRFI